MTRIFVIIAVMFLFLTGCKKQDNPSNSSSPNLMDSLKNGLWGYYNFNGTMSDQSGKNHHMVGYNGIQISYDLWGNDNGALDFDGVNDYAVIDSGKVFPEGNFSISFFFSPRNAAGRIFQKANMSDAKGASFGIGFDDDLNNHKLVFNVTKNENICSGYTDATTSNPVTVPRLIYAYAWYHIVIEFVNGQQKVYVNGSLLTSQSTTNQSFHNCPLATFNLGTWWNVDPHYFNGKLDNLRIYTRALSDNEVNYLYEKEL